VQSHVPATPLRHGRKPGPPQGTRTPPLHRPPWPAGLPRTAGGHGSRGRSWTRPSLQPPACDPPIRRHSPADGSARSHLRPGTAAASSGAGLAARSARPEPLDAAGAALPNPGRFRPGAATSSRRAVHDKGNDDASPPPPPQCIPGGPPPDALHPDAGRSCPAGPVRRTHSPHELHRGLAERLSRIRPRPSRGRGAPPAPCRHDAPLQLCRHTPPLAGPHGRSRYRDLTSARATGAPVRPAGPSPCRPARCRARRLSQSPRPALSSPAARPRVPARRAALLRLPAARGRPWPQARASGPPWPRPACRGLPRAGPAGGGRHRATRVLRSLRCARSRAGSPARCARCRASAVRRA
jgi:hypothetical protein